MVFRSQLILIITLSMLIPEIQVSLCYFFANGAIALEI